MNESSADELILGKQLIGLSDRLNTSKQHVMVMYGMGPARWYDVTAKKHADEPLISRYAILTRLLGNHPDLYPNTSLIRFSTVYDLCKDIEPDFKPEHLAIILGLEPNSGQRLMQKSSRNTNTIDMMLFIMHSKLSSAVSKEDKKYWFNLFKGNAEEEAKARLIDLDVLWKKGGWSNSSKHPSINSNPTKRTRKKV